MGMILKFVGPIIGLMIQCIKDNRVFEEIRIYMIRWRTSNELKLVWERFICFMHASTAEFLSKFLLSKCQCQQSYVLSWEKYSQRKRGVADKTNGIFRNSSKVFSLITYHCAIFFVEFLLIKMLHILTSTYNNTKICFYATKFIQNKLNNKKSITLSIRFQYPIKTRLNCS